MKALDRKLLRDLRLMWSQALTIALVVASGIGGFITTLSAVDSLEAARDRYYADGHFADIFATVKRAPRSLLEQVRQLPGVADAQDTTEFLVRLDLPGFGPQAREVGEIDNAKEVKRAMDTAHLGKAHVVASAFGAAVAIDFALQHPDRIALSSPSGRWTYDELRLDVLRFPLGWLGFEIGMRLGPATASID